MSKQNCSPGLVCSGRHYAIGQHYRWEAAAHEAGQEFLKKHDRPWTYDERRHWIDAYLCRTPYAQQIEIVTCSLCEQVITDAILRGESPFQVSEEVKAQLAAAKVRVTMPDTWRYKKTKAV
jgi:hypothetical protein